MYTCIVRVLFLSCPSPFVDTVRHILPLPNFSHEFQECHELEDKTAEWASVIIAGPRCRLTELVKAASFSNQLLILLDNEWKLPPEVINAATDIWHWPMDESMAQIHFTRWQRNFARQKDLEECRQFLECLMDTSPNLVWYKRKDGVHELVNRVFCQTVNKTREDVQGRGHAYIWNVEHEDPACIESEKIVMKSGETHISEEEIDTGEGKRQLRTYKSPLRNDDGSMMGTIGIGIDITREKIYYENLLRNSAVLEDIFTSMDCGVLTHSFSGGRLLRANSAALRLLGAKSFDELESGFCMVARTVDDNDKSKLRVAIASLKNPGDSVSYEYKVKHDDGSILYVMGTARLVEQEGELVCQRFLLDCTARRQAQEMEAQRRRLWQEELVRALCVDYQVVCVFDALTGEGYVLQLLDFPDHALWEIFSSDLPLQEKFGKYVRENVYDEDKQICSSIFMLSALKEKLAREKTCYFNYRVTCGKDIHYFQLKAVRGGAINDTFSIVVGLQSIDERARESILQQNRLQAALAQAKQASEAKSVFLSNMSHDIRTPMNAIAGYTSLALNSLDNREVLVDYLGKIGLSCGHMISLINDILNMSHIESGKLRLDKKWWNLSELLQEVWNMACPAADAKKQIMSLERNITDQTIFCDKLRLSQILLNFLGNAVKFTPDGGRICMNVTQISGSRDEAIYEFKVSDNGIGMSEEFLKVIFLPFERAPTSIVAGIQGTGLGMAIANKLVQIMGGEIKVRSKLGVGTEFVFRIPFKTDCGSRSFKENCICGLQNGRTYPPLSPGKDFWRILLAEDNAMNQEIACEFLKSAGYVVDVAENGRIAVEMLTDRPAGYYDIILMDVQMPVLDGYSATNEIRSLTDKTLSNIPIVAMTANSFEEDRQKALTLGMNGHIAKPVDFGSLFIILAEILSSKNIESL